MYFNPLNAELNPICHLLALLGGATIVVVSRLRVKFTQVNKVRTFSRTESAIQDTTAPLCSMDGSLEGMHHR